MELSKRTKIIAIVIILIIIVLSVVSFLDLRSNNGLLKQYVEQNLAKDEEGNQYKLVCESKFPQDYGEYIFLYKSTNGWDWDKIGEIPTDGYEYYEAWGYSFAYGGKGVFGSVFIGIGKGKKAVYFSKSLNNGIAWSKPIPINDDITGQRSSPKIAIKDENIFVAWIEESGKRPSGIYFCSSYDGGKNWNENVWIRQGGDLRIAIRPDRIEE